MKDPELLQEAKKEHLRSMRSTARPSIGILANMYATPQPIIDKVTAIFVPKE